MNQNENTAMSITVLGIRIQVTVTLTEEAQVQFQIHDRTLLIAGAVYLVAILLVCPGQNVNTPTINPPNNNNDC